MLILNYTGNTARHRLKYTILPDSAVLLLYGAGAIALHHYSIIIQYYHLTYFMCLENCYQLKIIVIFIDINYPKTTNHQLQSTLYFLY